MKETDFDVIIVGVGTGGCTVAKILEDKGYSIALVDKKKKEDVGNKICGDAITEECLLLMENIFGNLKEPIENEIRESVFVFPDGSEIKLEAENTFILNRHKMGQIILNKILKNKKIRFFDHTTVLDIKKNEIFVLDLEKNELFSLKAKIIVDASGFDALLRRSIKVKDTESDLKHREFGVAFREIIKVKEWKKNDSCFYFLDNNKLPHGYAWIFPKGNNYLNVGLGFERIDNKNPKFSYHSFFNFKKLKVLSSGGGMIPLRRSLSNLVDDNFLMLGDAACHVTAINGGGIHNSIIAGDLAASTIIDALNKEKYDKETLWDYNIKFQTKYGKKLAREEILKVFVNSLSQEELKNIMLKGKNKISFSTFKVSLYNILNLTIFILSMKNFHLLKKCIKVLKYVQKIDKLYEDYPSEKEKLSEWDFKVKILFDKIYEDFY